MQGRLVVVDGAEYDKMKFDRTPPNATTAPTTQATQTASR